MSQTALQRLAERFPDAVTSTHPTAAGDDFAGVQPAAIVEVCRYAKFDLGFNLLLSICGVDRLLLPENDPRFEVVYHLRSIDRGHKVHLKARLPESRPELPSVTSVWRGADWWERHTFDLYGVRFTGHPNLKRLYLYDEFQGHPLRKDYPLRGRQPLVPEREIDEVARGPGANPVE